MKNTNTSTKSSLLNVNQLVMASLMTCLSLSPIMSTTAQAKVNSKTADKFYMMVNNHKVKLGDSLDGIEHQLGIAHNRNTDEKTNSESLSWWFDNGLTLVAIFKDNNNSKQDKKTLNASTPKLFKPKPKARKHVEIAKPEILDVLGYSHEPKTVEQLETEITKVIADRKMAKAEAARRQQQAGKEQQQAKSGKILSEVIISSSSQIKNSYLIAYGEKVSLHTKSIEQLESTFNDTYRCLSYFEQGKLGWVDFTVRDGKGKNYYANFSSINDSTHSLTEVEGLIETKQKLVDSVSMSKGLENHSIEVYCKDWYER